MTLNSVKSSFKRNGGVIVNEKRFKINSAYSKSLQGLIGVICDNDEGMYMTDVVDLLNSLSEENEQLKKDVKYFNETYSAQEYGLDIETHIQLSSPIPSREELLKENEQLKLEIKGMEELLRSYQKTV